MKNYETIIIGAGHNGLVSAAYLAKASKKVLVLERRAIPGGTLVTEEFDGFKADTLQSGTLRPDIIRDLNLPRFGLKPKPVFAKSEFISLLDAGHVFPFGDNVSVTYDDPVKATESIKRFSAKDAARWPDFLAFMSKATSFLEAAYRTSMPRLPKPDSLSEGLPLAQLGLKLRSMGRKDMLDIIRALPMTAVEFVEEWFESEQVKAALASLGIHGVTLGVMSAGTTFNMLHNWLNRGGLAHRHIGQAGRVTGSLVEAAKAYGAEIRLNAEVARIKVKGGRATGVVLSNGEEIDAATVLSATDPKRTFLSLIGPMELTPTFVWNVQSIKMRGSVAKVHLGVASLPDGMMPSTTYAVAPSLRYLEKAYDAAKYGEISGKPYLEVTTTENVVSVHFQFAPFQLKKGNWEEGRKRVENLAINTLAEHFPDLKSKVQSLKSLTPADLETTYSLIEGDLNHGQIMLDQFMFMRPIPGWSNHKTPIEGLYLCGSGVHAGGGVSGASGRNAAKVVLKEK
ncbi:MAG: NAD(P)/FAD-dependent oxidoreductase [Anaerolineales bacterium]|nr:NAD(P)/FAD-dependent oxidoreductase [Anaerolineales bacterium]